MYSKYWDILVGELIIDIFLVIHSKLDSGSVAYGSAVYESCKEFISLQTITHS